MSHKPDGRLPLLSARPAVTPTTLNRAATNFAARWTEARWVWTVCLRLLPDKRQRVNDSRRLYDECPVGCLRRTADASSLSAGFRAKKPSVDPPPDPTTVSDWHRKQTDTQSVPSASSVVRGNESKIVVNEENAVQFCGSDARSLAVWNYSFCTDSTCQQYFWYSGDVCETKEWPKSIPNRNMPVLVNTVFG